MRAGPEPPRAGDPASHSAAPPAAAAAAPSFRDAAGLLSGTMLLGLGEKLGERFLPLFLVNLGGGASAVGLYQAATNLMGAMLSLPGGYLSDRIGTKRTLQTFAAVAGVGFLILMFATHWPVAVIGGLLALSWSAVSLPAALVLITKAIRTKSTAWGVSVHSLVRRVPMALGPVVAGLFVAAEGEDAGLRLAFTVALGLALLTLVLQQWLIRPARAAREAGAPSPAPLAFRPIAALMGMSRPLRELFVADTLIRFCEQIPYAFVVLWCMREIAEPVSALQFGTLTAIEMVTAMLVYMPGAWLSTRIGKPASVVITFVFFAAFPLVLLAGHSFPVLIAAFVVRGLKELGEPTRKSLILDLCPVESRATYFGWYYLLRDTLATFAALLGAWIWSVSPAATLVASSAFGVVGVALYGILALRPRAEEESDRTHGR